MLELNRIHRMDALEGLKKLDDESIDLVITDPPYNIAAKGRRTVQQGKLMSTMEAWGQWDSYHPFDYDLLIMQVISQCYRVLKPGGAVYMFTARQDNGYFVRKAVQRGFTYRNQIVMVKKAALPSIFRNCWRSAFEVCMYLTKGATKTFNFPSQAECVNVYSYSVSHKTTTHPTEKPLELIKRLVAISSKPGDTVLDPFMGSGTTAVAAKEMGRSFLGFELNREYVTMARQRLRRVKRAQDNAVA